MIRVRRRPRGVQFEWLDGILISIRRFQDTDYNILKFHKQRLALDLKPAAQHPCQTNAAATPAAAPSATSCHHRCLVAVASSRVSFCSANIFYVPTISAAKFSLKFSVAPTLIITHSLVNASSKEVDS